MLVISVFIIVYALLTGGYKGFIYRKVDGETEIRWMPLLFALALFYLVFYAVNHLNK
jgi:hypothetical protein